MLLSYDDDNDSAVAATATATMLTTKVCFVGVIAVLWPSSLLVLFHRFDCRNQNVASLVLIVKTTSVVCQTYVLSAKGQYPPNESFAG